ncbi:hypothetical protein Efla_001335 [Eimeria flavescens]
MSYLPPRTGDRGREYAKDHRQHPHLEQGEQQRLLLDRSLEGPTRRKRKSPNSPRRWERGKPAIEALCLFQASRARLEQAKCLNCRLSSFPEAEGVGSEETAHQGRHVNESSYGISPQRQTPRVCRRLQKLATGRWQTRAEPAKSEASDGESATRNGATPRGGGLLANEHSAPQAIPRRGRLTGVQGTGGLLASFDGGSDTARGRPQSPIGRPSSASSMDREQHDATASKAHLLIPSLKQALPRSGADDVPGTRREHAARTAARARKGGRSRLHILEGEAVAADPQSWDRPGPDDLHDGDTRRLGHAGNRKAHERGMHLGTRAWGGDSSSTNAGEVRGELAESSLLQSQSRDRSDMLHREDCVLHLQMGNHLSTWSMRTFPFEYVEASSQLHGCLKVHVLQMAEPSGLDESLGYRNV